MGFMVTKPAGATDAEFEAYTRVLRYHGLEPSRVPRVPDPYASGRRWVAVWDARADAERFADELNTQTPHPGWQVEPTTDPPSVGPFGPILVQLVRRSDGLLLAVANLGRVLVQQTVPDAAPAASHVFVGTETWTEYRNGQRGLAEWVADVLPVLTGLTPDQLTELGYVVIDADTDQSWVHVPPAGVAAVPA